MLFLQEKQGGKGGYSQMPQQWLPVQLCGLYWRDAPSVVLWSLVGCCFWTFILPLVRRILSEQDDSETPDELYLLCKSSPVHQFRKCFSGIVNICKIYIVYRMTI